jgi:putative ATP-dependent endonuclease of the OLD family
LTGGVCNANHEMVVLATICKVSMQRNYMFRITSVHVRRFRSLLRSDLTGCGALNVLIGKNNSGKSNLLAAIDTAFSHFKTTEIAAAWSTSGRAQDEFTNRDTREPLQIGLEFEIDQGFNDQIREHLLLESTGLENAVQQLQDHRVLSAIVASGIDSNRAFRYVQEIDFGRIVADDDEVRTERAQLFRATYSIARDLYGMSTEMQNLREQLDDEVFKLQGRLTDRVFRDREYPLSRQMRISPALARDVDALFSRSVNAEQFADGLVRLRDSIQSKIDKLMEGRTGGTMRSFAGEVRAQPKYVQWIMEQLAGIELLHFREDRPSIGATEAVQLLQMKTRRGGTERLGAIQNTIKALLGVNIDAFEPEGSNQTSQRTAEMDIDEFLVEANGAGIRQALRIILDIELRKPLLVMIEEPEVHLHPGLERVMYGYLAEKSRSSQIFIATHSTNFVDASLSQNIYLISRPEESLSKIDKLVSPDDALKITDEIGLRPSTVFMFDKLIFVEGVTDEAVFREFAGKLDVNLTGMNVGFVQMGGASKFAHYAAESTIDLLSRRRIPMLFILDRDENEEADISRLVKKLGDRSRLHVLERREIENYLLVPHAIIKTISEKRNKTKRGQDLDVSVISKDILQAATGLKERVVDLRVRKRVLGPLYFDALGNSNVERVGRALDEIIARGKNLKAATEEMRGELDRVWDRDAAKLAPGSAILDSVFAQHELRYRKDVDAVRLASFMTLRDIDREIVGLITGITTL